MSNEAREPEDGFLTDPGRARPNFPPVDRRPLIVLPSPIELGLAELAEAPETCRPVGAGLTAGGGGGAMDVREPPIEGRDFGLAFDGVPVREGAPLDVAVASCLVGDFVGD